MLFQLTHQSISFLSCHSVKKQYTVYMNSPDVGVQNEHCGFKGEGININHNKA